MNIITLIPAYKPKYIVELLHSIRYQTLPSQRILISDDSPNGEFQQALRSDRIRPLLSGLNIGVAEGPRKGAYENIKHLLRLWNGSSDLVHLMFDDDVIFPEFYERHMVAHRSAELSCSISRRWTANEAGQPLSGLPANLRVPRTVANHPNRILALNAEVAFTTTIPECINWFGEFSNTVMRANTCEMLFKPEMAGVSYAGLWDLGYFLAASLRAPIGYIQDHLGYFRIGGTSASSDATGALLKGAFLGYVALALCGQRVGQLSREQTLLCYSIMATAMNNDFAQQEDMKVFCKVLPSLAASSPGAEGQFLEAWTAFHRKNGF
jgi:hypothetical protein